MNAKTMSVTLQQAHPLFLDRELGSISSVLRYLVPMADVQIAHADKVVGEPGRQFVAGHVFGFELLQIKNVRYRHAGQAVELFGILNQVFSQPEFVVAFDPGDACNAASCGGRSAGCFCPVRSRA